VSDRVATATLPLEREREGDSTMTTSCFLSELERARNEVRELQEERRQVSSPEELLHYMYLMYLRGTRCTSTVLHLRGT